MASAAPDRSARLSGAILVCIAAIAFSGKAVIIKLAYRYGVDAVTLLALRMVFSAPLFMLVAAWNAKRAPQEPLSGADARNIVILGIVGYYLSSYFDFLGLQYITAALERLLLFVHPTFVVLLSAALFARRVTGRDVVAIVLSYVGIGLVFGHDVMTQKGNVLLGSAWVLLSALTYAIYLLGSGRLVHRVGTLRFASYAGLVSCVAVVVHYAVTRDMHVVFSQPPEVYGYGLLMAVVSTVLPIILTSEGIKRLGASHASIVGAVGPVATIFLGYLFLGEEITVLQVAGAACVLAGILAISLAKKKQ
jgi:drug/metabolite transporter (DMT)-like permease